MQEPLRSQGQGFVTFCITVSTNYYYYLSVLQRMKVKHIITRLCIYAVTNPVFSIMNFLCRTTAPHLVFIHLPSSALLCPDHLSLFHWILSFSNQITVSYSTCITVYKQLNYVHLASNYITIVKIIIIIIITIQYNI